ncbi:MAG: O-antigen ligase family protein, partial [Pseudomonadota bacterium]
MPQSVPLRAPNFAATPLPRADFQRRSSIYAALPLVVVFYSFLLLPPEVSLNLVGVSLPTYRIALILSLAPSITRLLRRPSGWLNFIDIAVLVIGFWILLSFSMTYGIQQGVIRGGGVLIDLCISYFVARASISNSTDFRYFLMLILPGLIFAGALLALESLSGRLLFRPAFASVFGSASNAVTDGGSVVGLASELRLGLLRAYGPFSHPILGGAFMLSFLPLFYFSGLRSAPFYCGVAVALTGLFSLSSAAFLSIMIAVAAIGIDKVKRYFPNLSWWQVSSLLGLAVLTAHVASQSGILSVLARMTLKPHTAQYRLLIWEYGWKTVEQHPWFGIGYNSWDRLAWMHDSVDAHFLLLGMRHGLLVPVLLVLAIFYGVIRLGLLAPRLR